MTQDPDDSIINVFKYKAILLAFYCWAFIWYKKKIIIHKDNTTVVLGLEDSILRGLALSSTQTVQ